MTHEERMAELRRIEELMKSNPAEALRRIREGRCFGPYIRSVQPVFCGCAAYSTRKKLRKKES